MQTIAQQLKVTEFPFEIKDSKGNVIYFEDSDGYWWKKEYDSQGNVIYFEDSDGYWCKREYNSQDKEIYCETSNGYWCKREYNSQDKEIYFENSNGSVIDDRPKNELTLEEIASKFGIPVDQLRIKD